jgi:biopolymer transport protein ExbD
MSEANLPPQEDELPANAEAFSARGKKRRRKLKMPGEDIGGLNLTAMMDMMTILLVFLVKSYTTDAEKFTLSEKLRPPQSTAVEEVKPAVTVTVTTEAIFVDDTQALLISDLQNLGDKALIPDLEEALNQRIDKLKEMEKLTGVPFDGSLLLVAHQTTPYNLLTAVLYTAGQAHFSDYRLMVMKKPKS